MTGFISQTPSLAQQVFIQCPQIKNRYAVIAAVEVRLKLEDEPGIMPVIFNPCAMKPDTGSFISVMKQNVQDLAEYGKYQTGIPSFPDGS